MQVTTSEMTNILKLPSPFVYHPKKAQQQGRSQFARDAMYARSLDRCVRDGRMLFRRCCSLSADKNVLKVYCSIGADVSFGCFTQCLNILKPKKLFTLKRNDQTV